MSVINENTGSEARPAVFLDRDGTLNALNSSSSRGEQPKFIYRYFVVSYDPAIGRSAQSLEELNNLLNDGWNPVRERPMGGAGGKPSIGFASLVLLEKDE